MNPFLLASSLGYSINDILKFVGSAFPAIGKGISTAQQAGYKPEDIVKFLGKSFNGQNMKRYEKDKKKAGDEWLKSRTNRKSESLMQEDIKRSKESKIGDLIGGAAGPLAGLALGGVAGALGGALAGQIGGLLNQPQEQAMPPPGGQPMPVPPMTPAGPDQGAEIPTASAGIPSESADVMAPSAAIPAQPPVMSPEGNSAMAKQFPSSGSISPREFPESEINSGKGNSTINQEMSPVTRMVRSSAGLLFPEIARQSKDPEKLIGILDKKYGKKWRNEIAATPQEAEAIATAAWDQIQKMPAQKGALSPKAEQALKRKRGEVVPKISDVAASEGEQEPLTQYMGKSSGKGTPLANVKELSALQSSNVRYMDYDPETKKLQVLFAPSGKGKGGVYDYFDVPQDQFDKLIAGDATAKTVGANKHRAWFAGKNPSIGRAVIDFLGQKNETGEAKYVPHKLEESEINNNHVQKLRQADQVHQSLWNIDSFEDIFLKAQAKTRGEGLKMEMEALKSLPDAVLNDIIYRVTKEISREIKSAAQQGNKKVYRDGGREQEIKRRVLARVEEMRNKPRNYG